mmetsp:Transcript_28158/g.64426  ORF Transcript_28158/g.64426 Transcript_28158/m.64426 type:complete len:93 (+) Transcript_28158:187-465(+)|eukprot:CAMPEP_0113304998 /NCGR_PEP_ID=MMETSP0010_2-20120614/4787_1 /TAXON_ID=216773 ORGANISM="Corethron hystrix, Strain 308" /NCGR_SAMPLE_ID=MMETSP0010_2 /ASSEMBLY_ACC=CAM_ASM_000155 /LENGTH=92 /DNA_ID=CAMNT_0000159301 /DNA_START=117 /DNA_END=395 /DNA_ORIENTATION=- /assembly_acc=CAM_ASM_000155
MLSQACLTAARRVTPIASRSTGRINIQTRSMGGHHNVFEPPFNKMFVGPLVSGIVGVGFYAIWGACLFQNKKHGFPLPPEEDDDDDDDDDDY